MSGIIWALAALIIGSTGPSLSPIQHPGHEVSRPEWRISSHPDASGVRCFVCPHRHASIAVEVTAALADQLVPSEVTPAKKSLVAISKNGIVLNAASNENRTVAARERFDLLAPNGDRNFHDRPLDWNAPLWGKDTQVFDPIRRRVDAREQRAAFGASSKTNRADRARRPSVVSNGIADVYRYVAFGQPIEFCWNTANSCRQYWSYVEERPLQSFQCFVGGVRRPERSDHRAHGSAKCEPQKPSLFIRDAHSIGSAVRRAHSGVRRPFLLTEVGGIVILWITAIGTIAGAGLAFLSRSVFGAWFGIALFAVGWCGGCVLLGRYTLSGCGSYSECERRYDDQRSHGAFPTRYREAPSLRPI